MLAKYLPAEAVPVRQVDGEAPRDYPRPDDNPLGYGEQDWRQLLAGIGQPAWRANQLLKWIHQRGITDYNDMTDLPLALRQQLQSDCPIGLPVLADKQRAADGVSKYVFEAPPHNLVEAVRIPAAGRVTLCISSQAGCALACAFCETGRQGFARHLSAAEIIGQLWTAKFACPEDPDPIGNLVLMGMGEPLLNLKAVQTALELMFSDYAYGLARRRVTLSTAGVVPGIEALTPGPTLALSLHAPDDALRDQLVPINRKYPIAEVLAACRRYLDRLPDRRRLTVEYTLMRGVNDSLSQADALVKLLRQTPCKVNLIPCNPVPGLDFSAPGERQMSAFAGRLAGHLPVTLRRPRGREIGAACGQLAGRVQPRGRIPASRPITGQLHA